MKGLHVQNLTNLYTKTNVNKINRDFKRILEQSRGGICGIEINSKRGEIDFTLVSPSFLKQNEIMRSSSKGYLEVNSLFLEGYLQQPFFMPIYSNYNGEFIDRIKTLPFILKDNEYVFMQWLFRRAFNWQDKAIQMYSSYILGNDNPLTFNAARKVQEKVLHFTSKLGATIEKKDYIEEAEQKILSEGYCFKLEIVIEASIDRQEIIINKLQSLLDQYTFFNTIKLAKVKSKNFIQQIDNCNMLPHTKYQILSKSEILSLFGGNTLVFNEEVIEDISNENEMTIQHAIDLLPNYPIQTAVENEGILSDIAEALKRVGITNIAKVYNGKIFTGIRLKVVQFGIPKEKRLTDITKKLKDIQAVLGVEGLSIEQGNEPDTVKLLMPNEEPTIVGLRNLLEQESFIKFSQENRLAFIVGVDEINNPIYLSLAELPHLLVAGTTGSGKSVFMNVLTITLALTHSPQELQLYMIDPKQVEFQHYKEFPHVKELITDMSKAEAVLYRLTEEMDRRYDIFKKAGVNHIDVYNEKVLNGKLGEGAAIMPYIVTIIDEFADLMSTHPQAEEHIIRLGFKSRSAGIHVVVATQRPSSDIITGKLKSNMLNAISFNLGSSTNYRTVFGTGIPYTLLDRGDGVVKSTMLTKEFQRFQGAVISANKNEEEKIYKNIAAYLNKKYKNKSTTKEIAAQDEMKTSDTMEDDLFKLKKLIGETKKCKTAELREIMGIKSNTLSELMKQLVEDGFLELGNSRKEGYQINEEKFNEWLEENGF